MSAFVFRFKSGKVKYYAFPVLKSDGKYHINLVKPDGRAYICAINDLPFDTEQEANDYLQIICKNRKENTK